VWVKDTNLVSSITQSVTTFVDTVPPTLTLSNFTNGFITNSATLTIYGATNDAAPSSGLASFVLKLNGSTLIPQVNAGVTGGFSVPSVSFTANATNTLIGILVDNAGNTNAVTNAIVVDTVAPTFSADNLPQYTNVTSFSVNDGPQDNFSGIAAGYCKYSSTYGTYSGGVFQFTGLYPGTSGTLSAWVADAAGNSSITQSTTVSCVTNGPSPVFLEPGSFATNTTFAVSIVGYTNWPTGLIAPFRSLTETINGAARSVTLSAANWQDQNSYTLVSGTNLIVATVADMAGNVNAATDMIIVSTTPPQCMVTNLSGSVITQTNLTLSISNYDAWCKISGLYIYTNGASCYSLNKSLNMTNVTFAFSTMVTNIQVWCMDAAGNSSATNSYSRIPPTPSINLTNGQIVSNTQIITGTAPDGGGVASVWMSVNGGAYAEVTGSTNWTNSYSFSVWTNTVSCYSMDSSGYTSAVTTVSPIVTLPWVTTIGNFTFSYGAACDSAGNIYLANTAYNRILKILTNGTWTVLAGTGSAGFYDNTYETLAVFNSPNSIALDSNGNVYVADAGNNRIRIISNNGFVTTYAGTGSANFVNGYRLDACFNYPTSLVFDPAGNLYVSDSQNYCIRMIGTNGMVSTYAGIGGIEGYVNGPSNLSLFSCPRQLSMDSTGRIILADQADSTIRVISTNGIVSTLAGTGGSGFQNGYSNQALFYYPQGVCIDSNGSVYVADFVNDLIREISPSGMVSTFSGQPGVNSERDGIPQASAFAGPCNIVMDPSGNLIVLDLNSGYMRKIVLHP
jgi:hypothetical protein